MSLFNIKSEFKAIVGNDTHKRIVTNEQIFDIVNDLHTALTENQVLAPFYVVWSDNDKAKLACELVDFVNYVWGKCDTQQWSDFDTNARIYYINMLKSDNECEIGNLTHALFYPHHHLFYDKNECQIQRVLGVTGYTLIPF